MRLVPTMVLETLHEIAKIKGMSFEEVSTSVLKNFMKVFKSGL
jgi:Tat protein secretion system quality control protein TatD with DNase activity